MSNELTQKQPRVTLNGRPIYESDFKAMDKDVRFIISTFSTHALKLDDAGTGTVGQLRVVEKTPGLYWIGCGWIVEALDRFRIWAFVKVDTNQKDVLMYLEPDQFEGWHLVAAEHVAVYLRQCGHWNKVYITDRALYEMHHNLESVLVTDLKGHFLHDKVGFHRIYKDGMLEDFLVFSEEIMEKEQRLAQERTRRKEIPLDMTALIKEREQLDELYILGLIGEDEFLSKYYGCEYLLRDEDD